MSTADPGAPFAPLQLDPEPAPARSRLQFAVGGVLASLVVVAGVFAVTQLRAADGGSGSPEAAVSALFDAVADEDLVGIADVMLPGERRAIGDPLLEAFGELVRLEVLSSDFDASSVGGFDFEVDDLQLTVDPVVDDIVNVYASGRMTATLDGTSVPIGRRILDIEGVRDELANAPADTESELFSDVRITTVLQEGRWYVSLFHSLGEEARLSQGHAPIPASEALVARGASSPEAALDALLGAAERLDLRSALEMIDPGEASALHRYAPLFLGDALRGVTDAPVEISLEVLDSTVEQQGDRARIILEGYSATITTDDPMWGRETITMSYEDGCSRVRVESEYGYDDGWYDDGYDDEWGTEYSPWGGTVEPDGTVVVCDDDVLASPMMAAFPLSGLDGASGLVFTRHGNEWYFSPIATYTDALLMLLRELDDQKIDELSEWWQSMFTPYAMYDDYGYDTGFTYAEGSTPFDTIAREIDVP